jgi:hypothetical protein
VNVIVVVQVVVITEPSSFKKGMPMLPISSCESALKLEAI